MKYIEVNGTADEVAAVISRFRTAHGESVSTSAPKKIRLQRRRRLSAYSGPQQASVATSRPYSGRKDVVQKRGVGRPRGVKNGEGLGRAAEIARAARAGRGPDKAPRRKKRLVQTTNARKGWDDVEERLLNDLRVRQGHAFKAIGKRLGRSTKACRERMNRMSQEGRWQRV